MGNFGGIRHDSSQFFKKDQHLHETLEVILPGQPTRKKAGRRKATNGHGMPCLFEGRLKYISSIRVQPFQPAMLDDRSVPNKNSQRSFSLRAP